VEQANLFYRFGAALAIGFLIGLQREYAHGGPGGEIFAGERTLALMVDTESKTRRSQRL